MTRAVAVLRPEPGNAATVARLRAAGLTAIALPLFGIRPLMWHPPNPGDHDALLLTSANTVRHGGPALDLFRALPAFAVGETTAEAARAEGFQVVATGTRDGAAIVDDARKRGFSRLLHLGGEDRAIETGGVVTAAIAVYASEPIPVSPTGVFALDRSIVLLHSARAARALGALVDAAGVSRIRVAIAAISLAVAAAAGPAWRACAVATTPTDEALIAAARTLID